MCHNYWAWALRPARCNDWAHVQQLLKSAWSRARTPPEKSPQWEPHALQLESSPYSPQLEKAVVQQWRPSAAKKQNKTSLGWIKETTIHSTWADLHVWGWKGCFERHAQSLHTKIPDIVTRTRHDMWKSKPQTSKKGSLYQIKSTHNLPGSTWSAAKWDVQSSSAIHAPRRETFRGWKVLPGWRWAQLGRAQREKGRQEETQGDRTHKMLFQRKNQTSLARFKCRRSWAWRLDHREAVKASGWESPSFSDHGTCLWLFSAWFKYCFSLGSNILPSLVALEWNWAQALSGWRIRWGAPKDPLAGHLFTWLSGPAVPPTSPVPFLPIWLSSWLL